MKKSKFDTVFRILLIVFSVFLLIFNLLSLVSDIRWILTDSQYILQNWNDVSRIRVRTYLICVSGIWGIIYPLFYLLYAILFRKKYAFIIVYTALALSIPVALLSTVLDIILYASGSSSSVWYAFYQTAGVFTSVLWTLIIATVISRSVITKRKKDELEGLAPEQALKLLEKELELGIITPEKFAEKRTEVIERI